MTCPPIDDPVIVDGPKIKFSRKSDKIAAYSVANDRLPAGYLASICIVQLFIEMFQAFQGARQKIYVASRRQSRGQYFIGFYVYTFPALSIVFLSNTDRREI